MPLIFSVVLHVVFIIMMMLIVPKKNFRTENPVHPNGVQTIIQATAVDAKTLEKQIKDIRLEEEQKKRQEQEKVQELERRAASAAKKREMEERRLQDLLAAQKLAAHKLEIEKKKKEQLVAQQKILQEKILKDMLAKERQQFKTPAASPVPLNQGEIDKYRAAILTRIQSNWHPPEQNSSLFCTMLVHLSADGVVASVELLRSSGDAALDRSAQIAIQRSSPLPMPQDPALLNEFRNLRIKMSPQDIQN